MACSWPSSFRLPEKNKVVAGLILLSFAASFAAAHVPALAQISSGTMTILLTVVISAGAAILFPRKQEEEAEAQ